MCNASKARLQAAYGIQTAPDREEGRKSGKQRECMGLGREHSPADTMAPRHTYGHAYT